MGGKGYLPSATAAVNSSRSIEILVIGNCAVAVQVKRHNRQPFNRQAGWIPEAKPTLL